MSVFCMSVSLFVVCMSVCLRICLSVSLYIYMSVCLFVSLPVSLSVYVSFCLYVCMHIGMFICLVVFINVCLFICLFVCPSVCHLVSEPMLVYKISVDTAFRCCVWLGPISSTVFSNASAKKLHRLPNKHQNCLKEKWPNLLVLAFPQKAVDEIDPEISPDAYKQTGYVT